MKLFALSSIAGASLILWAGHVPESLIEKQAALLKNAKTLKVTYVLRVAGVKSDVTLTYSKPNLLMVDSPSKLWESDGTTLWEYDKTAKTYTESPVTPELLTKKAESDEVFGWASFFTDDLLKKAADVHAGTSKMIKGVPATDVTFTFGTTEPKTITLYVDDKQGIARGFSFKGEKGDILAMADKIETSGDAMTADKFMFTAPSDAKKVAAATDASGTGWASVSGILSSNCLPCHGARRATAGFVATDYQSVMKGSNNGPIVTAGDPDNSKLVQLMNGSAQPKMPPQRTVPAADIDKIKAWIKDGAKQ